MQFLPADFASMFGMQTTPAPAAVSKKTGQTDVYTYANTKETASSFQDIFETNLQEYNSQNTPGLPFGFRSVRDDGAKIKSDDLNNLKGILSASGVDSTVLNGFIEKLNAISGKATIGNMHSAINSMAERKSLPLTEQEEIALSALLLKMGFTQQEAEEIEAHAAAGNGNKVLDAVKAKLSQKSCPINFNEAALLCRAADLGADASQQILAQITEAQEIELNPESFKQLFGPAHAELKTAVAELAKLRESLPVAIAQMFEVRRQEKDVPSADNRSSRLSERSAIFAAEFATSVEDEEEKKGKRIIHRKSAAALLLEGDAEQVVANSVNAKTKPGKTRRVAVDTQAEQNLLNKTGRNEAAHKGQKAEQPTEQNIRSVVAQAKATGAENAQPQANNVKAGANAAQNAANNAQPAANNTQNAANTAQAATNVAQAGGNAMQAGATQVNNKNANTATTPTQVVAEAEAVLAAPAADAARAFDNARHETGHNAGQDMGQQDANANLKNLLASKLENMGTPIFASPASNAENSSATTGQAKMAQEFQSKIFDQVERGMVRTLNDGAKQMVLRLDPPELGKLTLSLTMAQGEIKAVIRTENSATTQVISEQMAQLKQTLEEQGFKVASLEVETRTSQHAGTEHWSGAEQHNQEQELQEKSRFLRLARSRNTEGEALARSMQHIEQPASISATGLHIIA